MDCSICLEPIDIESMITPCKHNFHTLCIEQWIENCPFDYNEIPCPYCRTGLPINFVDMIDIYSMYEKAKEEYGSYLNNVTVSINSDWQGIDIYYDSLKSGTKYFQYLNFSEIIYYNLITIKWLINMYILTYCHHITFKLSHNLILLKE